VEGGESRLENGQFSDHKNNNKPLSLSIVDAKKERKKNAA
jgi:hypothetical protein